MTIVICDLGSEFWQCFANWQWSECWGTTPDRPIVPGPLLLWAVVMTTTLPYNGWRWTLCWPSSEPSADGLTIGMTKALMWTDYRPPRTGQQRSPRVSLRKVQQQAVSWTEVLWARAEMETSRHYDNQPAVPSGLEANNITKQSKPAQSP